jgi:hypothetical protein
MRVAVARAFVAVTFFLAAAAAGAEPALPGVSARAVQRPLNLHFSLPDDHVCAARLEPDPWRDASDALFFATAPTARLDAQELAAGSIVALVSMRVASALAIPRLAIVGVPLRTGLHFSTAGWHARWPFC